MTSGYKIDHRLLFARAKTIRELKPNYWWDADYGITLSGSEVTSWVDRIAGLELTQTGANRNPTWARYGLSTRSCLIFDGGDALFLDACPMAAWTAHTVLVQYQMLGHDATAIQLFLAAVQKGDDIDSCFKIGMSSLKVQMTLSRNDAAAVVGRGNTDILTTALPHVGVFTQNGAGDKWVHYLDGVEETIDPGTDAGVSFAGTTGLNAFCVGAYAGAQDVASEPLYGKIGQIVMWNKVL